MPPGRQRTRPARSDSAGHHHDAVRPRRRPRGSSATTAPMPHPRRARAWGRSRARVPRPGSRARRGPRRQRSAGWRPAQARPQALDPRQAVGAPHCGTAAGRARTASVLALWPPRPTTARTGGPGSSAAARDVGAARRVPSSPPPTPPERPWGRPRPTTSRGRRSLRCPPRLDHPSCASGWPT